jgi:microcystin-dependent protein
LSGTQGLPGPQGDQGSPGIGIVTGSIVAFAGSVAPSGWLVCNGSAVSRTTFADLFTTIGTRWGIGDGTTTFNLPDLRGRFLHGGPGPDARSAGPGNRASTGTVVENDDDTDIDVNFIIKT